MLLLNAVLTIEPLHAPCGIDQTLRAGIERMAFGANLDADIRRRRSRLEGIATGAGHYAMTVFRMNSSFHRTLSVG
jgi:hypothetical protein